MVAPDSKSGVYLLYGKEDFLKKEFIQKLRSDLFPSGQDRDMGFQQFEFPDNSLSLIVDFLQNASFFTSKKMAVYSGIDELEAEDRQRLLELVDSLASGSSLVLVSQETNVKKDPFLKKLSEKIRAIPCHLPFDKDLPQWVESRVRQLGKTIDRDAAYLVIERVGKDTALLSSAVEQLAVYTSEEKRIALKHAETLLGRSAQADAFRLIDLLLEKKLKSALENLDSLLREGSKIYEIVGALAGQVERLGRARTMMDEGFPSDTISTEMRLHPFFAGRFLEQAQRISKAKLESIAKDLLVCDEAVKTGKLGDRLALQRLFLKVCTS